MKINDLLKYQNIGLPEDILRMKHHGDYENAIRLIDIRLQEENLPDCLRHCLMIQREMMVRIEKIYPDCARIAPEDAPQRTVCWEMKLEKNEEFLVEYSYLHTAHYHDLEGQTAVAGTYDFDLEEQAPHIVFTPYIRALVKELTEGITDPLEKARIFYDFITKNMNYTFMPSYFLLENIPDTCAQNFNGDCGVFALLFLTLCRCAGIPAQWQSGFLPSLISAADMTGYASM